MHFAAREGDRTTPSCLTSLRDSFSLSPSLPLPLSLSYSSLIHPSSVVTHTPHTRARPIPHPHLATPHTSSTTPYDRYTIAGPPPHDRAPGVPADSDCRPQARVRRGSSRGCPGERFAHRALLTALCSPRFARRALLTASHSISSMRKEHRMRSKRSNATMSPATLAKPHRCRCTSGDSAPLTTASPPPHHHGLPTGSPGSVQGH